MCIRDRYVYVDKNTADGLGMEELELVLNNVEYSKAIIYMKILTENSNMELINFSRL